MELNHDKLNPEQTAAVKAALAYIARQKRTEHPKGIFDKAMLWIPDISEESPSVLRARDPSNYSKFNAARSLPHCAWLHGADETMTRGCLSLLTFKPTKAGLKRIAQSQRDGDPRHQCRCRRDRKGQTNKPAGNEQQRRATGCGGRDICRVCA